MLHPVNLPACASALRKVIDIQDKLLEIACTTDPRNIVILNANFIPDVAQWLWRNEQKLLKPLQPFSAHSNLAKKQQILNAFRHDLTYETHLDDSTFVFELQPKQVGASPMVIDIGKWLENFYDTLAKWGIPSSVTGYSFDISQQVILGEFDRANVDMRVCPVCDGTWMENTGQGIIGSIDHFLPRSKYPALSVHPMNLLPICVICNEKIKKDKDPLVDNRTRTLAHTFHPYHRPARDAVTLNVDSTRLWTFISMGQVTDDHISGFDDLFALPQRWQMRIDEVDRLVRRRVRDCVRVASRKSANLSQDEFGAMLDELIEDMGKEWGKGSLLYPATWWLRWQKQNKFQEFARGFGVQ